jgi:hypothetical protein
MPFNRAEASVISSDLQELGLSNARVKRLGTGLWDDSVRRQDQALEGGWFAAPDPRARRSFEKRYAQLYGTAPQRLASLAYDSVALASVLSQNHMSDSFAGSKSAVFQRANFLNPNGFSGIDGIFRFRENGLAERGLSVQEIIGGNHKEISSAPQTFQRAP